MKSVVLFARVSVDTTTGVVGNKTSLRLGEGKIKGIVRKDDAFVVGDTDSPLLFNNYFVLRVRDSYRDKSYAKVLDFYLDNHVNGTLAAAVELVKGASIDIEAVEEKYELDGVERDGIKYEISFELKLDDFVLMSLFFEYCSANGITSEFAMKHLAKAIGINLD